MYKAYEAFSGLFLVCLYLTYLASLLVEQLGLGFYELVMR
jgi:hypothetical protein